MGDYSLVDVAWVPGVVVAHTRPASASAGTTRGHFKIGQRHIGAVTRGVEYIQIVRGLGGRAQVVEAVHLARRAAVGKLVVIVVVAAEPLCVPLVALAMRRRGDAHVDEVA